METGFFFCFLKSILSPVTLFITFLILYRKILLFTHIIYKLYFFGRNIVYPRKFINGPIIID